MSCDEPLSPWPDPGHETWAQLHAEADRGDAEYHGLLAAHRVLADRLAGATPPPELSADLTARLLAIADELAAHQVEEAARWDGWHPELPGRGLPVLPPYVVDSEGDSEGEASLTGRVTFGRFYLGGNGTAHGGTPPLLFDDVFGRIANQGFDGVARTAYLHVDFRAVTPLHTELRFAAHRDRVDGRKRWVSGTLTRPDGVVACEASALFLQLLPGQP